MLYRESEISGHLGKISPVAKVKVHGQGTETQDDTNYKWCSCVNNTTSNWVTEKAYDPMNKIVKKGSKYFLKQSGPV